ncbi:MAG TPA: putative sulfate exporter family transporter [Xanthobacteraceae bacterium]|nr:putative sulfate exporter family transporter [Xanthobacteraceae bacterium]
MSPAKKEQLPQLIDQLHRLLPGVLLCVAITGVATLLQLVETHVLGQAYLEALVLAILLGVALRTAWMPEPRFIPGVAFSAKFLLECAVVMLGASVSIATVLALGSFLLVGIASVVAMALGITFAISRAIGLPVRMAILIACGNSICGNSAIAAVAPAIGADSDEIAASISFTAVLGVIVVLTLPMLVPVLQLSLTQYGVLAGLTVYAVPQVLAATLPIGALSNQVGTIVKLVRVLMLGPVVLGLSLLARDLRAERTGLHTNKSGLDWQDLVPWFIVGFLVILIVRSLGLVPQVALPLITHTAAVLTTIAMAALGLGVDIRVVAKSGLRLILAVTASLIVLGSISYALIRVAGIP